MPSLICDYIKGVAIAARLVYRLWRQTPLSFFERRCLVYVVESPDFSKEMEILFSPALCCRITDLARRRRMAVWAAKEPR